MTPPDAIARIRSISNAYLAEADAELVVASLRPALRLVRAREAQSRSHLGGMAWLAASMPWPAWDGMPLSLLASIDLTELPPGGTDMVLPRHGILNFFYDADRQPWGSDPLERDGWRVIFVPDPATAVPRTPPAGALAFPEHGVEPVATVTHPGWEEAVMAPIYGRAPDALLGVESAIERDVTLPAPLHQLGGWPNLVQGPWQEECQLALHGLYLGDAGYDQPGADALRAGATDWRLLAQFDSDDELGWMWGDVGLIYYAIREQDLAAHAFDRCWFVLQCA